MRNLGKLLVLAENQAGYMEKDNDRNLDVKVGSTARDDNHTKYARDLTTLVLRGCLF